MTGEQESVDERLKDLRFDSIFLGKNLLIKAMKNGEVRLANLRGTTFNEQMKSINFSFCLAFEVAHASAQLRK